MLQKQRTLTIAAVAAHQTKEMSSTVFRYGTTSLMVKDYTKLCRLDGQLLGIFPFC